MPSLRESKGGSLYICHPLNLLCIFSYHIITWHRLQDKSPFEIILNCRALERHILKRISLDKNWKLKSCTIHKHCFEEDIKICIILTKDQFYSSQKITFLVQFVYKYRSRQIYKGNVSPACLIKQHLRKKILNAVKICLKKISSHQGNRDKGRELSSRWESESVGRAAHEINDRKLLFQELNH